MIFVLLLDLISILILILLNITITILSTVYRLFQELQTSEMQRQQIIRLQSVQLALACQQEIISWWLDKINIIIQ